ncbi:GNAT family N-acetyltransferase [candidate division KSB1 bacterium]|nr:GNAT family N-acetyltransferase [candidate division KSB1 bacterium]
MPTISFKKIIYNIHHRGLWGCLFMASYRMLQMAFPIECILFYRKKLVASQPNVQIAQPLQVGLASHEDIQHLDPKQYDLTGFEDVDLKYGHECYLARLESVVGYVWVSHDSIYDDRIFDINLREDQAYMYKAFTHPEFRGRGIYPTLLNDVCEKLADQGIRTAYIATSIENVSSIRGIRKAGFERLGTVYFFKFGPFQKLIVPNALCTAGSG